MDTIQEIPLELIHEVQDNRRMFPETVMLLAGHKQADGTASDATIRRMSHYRDQLLNRLDEEARRGEAAYQHEISRFAGNAAVHSAVVLKHYDHSPYLASNRL